MSLRVLDCFAGIGGFSLGFDRAGFESVAFVEIDPFCQAVLRKHWPGAWIHDDVRSLTGELVFERLGYMPEVVIGSPPCQPISTAGRRKGREDERWLWPAFLGVIRAVRPVLLCIENVAGLRTLGADEWLGDLAAEGYSASCLVVGADDVGAPHHRKRVFIVGRLAHTPHGRREAGPVEHRKARADGRLDAERRGSDVADAERARREGCGTDAHEGRPGLGEGLGVLAHADIPGQRSLGSGGLLDGERATLGHDADGRDAGLPEWPPRPDDFATWARVLAIEPGLAPATSEAQPTFRGVAPGLSPRMARRWRRRALKALGNAVVPAVAHVIARAVMASMEVR